MYLTLFNQKKKKQGNKWTNETNIVDETQQAKPNKITSTGNEHLQNLRFLKGISLKQYILQFVSFYTLKHKIYIFKLAYTTILIYVGIISYHNFKNAIKKTCKQKFHKKKKTILVGKVDLRSPLVSVVWAGFNLYPQKWKCLLIS